MKEPFFLICAVVGLIADVITLASYATGALQSFALKSFGVSVSSRDLAGATAVVLIYAAAVLLWKLSSRFIDWPRPFGALVATLLTSLAISPVLILWLRIFITDDWGQILFLGFAPVWACMAMILSITAFLKQWWRM